MEFVEVMTLGNMIFSFLLFLLVCFCVVKIHILETVLKSLLKQNVSEAKMPGMMGPPGPMPGMNASQDNKAVAQTPSTKPHYMG